MFTGLIEEVGKMLSVSKREEAMRLAIACRRIQDGMAIGDSIAVNGVCLTVTSFDAGMFTVDVTPQTYRHSNLKDIRPGEPLNLERAMLAGGRFGGHIVQGHADGTAAITGREADGNAVVYRLTPHDPGLLRYIIPQGSVTIDGISLTVASVEGNSFTVAIIPHTLAQTALQYKQPGAAVNIEGDILGKYVDHLLHYGNKRPQDTARSSGLTAAFLSDNGFI